MSVSSLVCLPVPKTEAFRTFSLHERAANVEPEEPLLANGEHWVNLPLPHGLSEPFWMYELALNSAGDLLVIGPEQIYHFNHTSNSWVIEIELKDIGVENVEGTQSTARVVSNEMNSYLFLSGYKISDSDNSNQLLVFYTDNLSNKYQLLDVPPIVAGEDVLPQRLLDIPSVDTDGNIWFLVEESSLDGFRRLQDTRSILMRLDATHNSIDTVLDVAFSAESIVISGNSHLFAFGREYDSGFEKYQLQYYAVDEHNLRLLGSTSGYDILGTRQVSFDRYDYLFLDQNNDVWVSNRGWYKISTNSIESLGDWYHLVGDRVFLQKNVVNEHEVQFEYIRPNWTFHTSDNVYWFGSLQGIVTFDMKQQVWCKRSNFPAYSLKEDNHGFLWLLSEQGLYRMNLSLFN